MTGYRKEMARQLAQGELLLYIDDFGGLIDLAQVMEAEGGGEIFLPLPNEEGGATAQVECWSAISANTRNPRAAAALLAFLLEEGQDMSAYPSTLTTLPVRRSSLEAALKALGPGEQNQAFVSLTLGVVPELLGRSLDAILRVYGDFGRYFRAEYGIDEIERARLRQMYTEPAE